MLEQGYGILPNSLLYDKELTPNAKLLFVLVSSMCAKDGTCYASNRWLGMKLGVSGRQIQNLLVELNKYIRSVSKEKKNGDKQRILSLSTPMKNISPPHEINFTQDNTSKDNNKYSSETIKQADEIYKHYLQTFHKPETRYRFTEKRKKKVFSRLKEFSAEDIKQAITNAYRHDFYSGRSGQWDGCDLLWMTKSTENTEKLLNLKVEETEDERLNQYRKNYATV